MQGASDIKDIPARTEPWRAFFHRVDLLRVPLSVSAFAGLMFALPDQSIDSYISIAQNIRLARPWAHLTDISRLTTAAVLFAALAGVAGLGAALWLVCNEILGSDHPGKHGLRFSRFRWWTLPGIVALPAIGLTIGIARASTQIPSERVSAALLASKDVPPALARSIVRSAFDPSLLHQITGLAALLTIILLLAAIGAEWRNSRSMGDLPDFTGITRRLLGAALLIVLLIAFSCWSVRTAQALGSVALFALFLAAVTLAAGWIEMRSRVSGIPILGLLILWAIALAAVGINDNHQIRSAYKARGSEQSGTPRMTASAAFAEWYRSRPKKAYHDRGLRFPVYVVAAQGGGIYAAYHAATFLAGLQDDCPSFRKHLFAISAVSGGSVGAAFFNALLKGEPSHDAACSADMPPTLSDRTDRALKTDLLAPLIAGLLVPDFVQRFIPYAFPVLDRARALERALEATWERSQPRGGANPLAARLADQWQAAGDEPALLMGTTEVASGRLRVLAPFDLSSRDFKVLGHEQGYDELSVSTAAVLSARFPWITPSAWFSEQQLRDGKPHVAKIKIVDGGIFENSGVAIALELIRAIEQEAARLGIADKIDLNLIVLTDGEGVTPTFPRLDFGEFLDPIRALLSARSARAPLTIAQAERELDGRIQPEYAQFRIRPTRVRRVPLEAMGVHLPLGWHLSHTAMQMIGVQTGDETKCQPKEGYRQSAVARFDADCVVDLVFHELNGTLIEKLKSLNAS